MWVICFVIQGKRFCIEIPILIRRWPWPEPDPDWWWRHWVISEEPSPDPWVVDLPVLATLDYLASRMTDSSARVKEQIQVAIRESMEEISGSLPEGIDVRFEEQAGKG